MKKDVKYVAFPLHLISGFPAKLPEAFDYGIVNFSESIKYNQREVYRQVIYQHYRGDLTNSLKKHLNELISTDWFTPDPAYSGFNCDGSEFNPEENINELVEAGEKYEDFNDECVRLYQIKQALGILDITSNIENLLRVANKVQKEVNHYEAKFAKDVLVMISIEMFFKYYNTEKSAYEMDLLVAFLAIKSIIGNKELAITNKKFILMRMTGAKNVKVLEENLKIPSVRRRFEKYSKRHHYERLLSELLSRNFLQSKMAVTRGIAISTQLSFDLLPIATKNIFESVNSKKKRDQNKELEKQARETFKRLNNND